MALNAAWPLLVNARPADLAAEICSATGLTHAGGGAPVLPDKGYHASHCNLCPFGADRGAGIAATATVLPLPASNPARVFARGETPRHQTALYPAAPPRAPPFPS
jgi:hypothetical protein